MRVLTVNRCPSEQEGHQGGDEIQRKLLARHLPPQVEVIHLEDRELELERAGVDLVHAYNIVLTETAEAAGIAEKLGVPLAIQTVYPPPRFLGAGVLMSGRETVRELALRATVLLNNLECDPSYMAEDLDIPVEVLQAKSMHVPAAAPSEWFLFQPDPHIIPPQPYVLCAARFEDRKAQDKLLEAMIETGLEIPIWLVGDERHPVFERCQRLAEGRNWIHLKGRTPWQEMVHWFAGAAVSILPTHYDNPGLTNLEAGITGCEVVTSGLPGIREYLGDLASYGEPGYPFSYIQPLAETWERALVQKGRNRQLAEHVRANHTWEVAAARLSEAYAAAVGGGAIRDHAH